MLFFLMFFFFLLLFLFVFLFIIYNNVCDKHVFQQSPAKLWGKKIEPKLFYFYFMREYINKSSGIRKEKVTSVQSPKKELSQRHIFTYHIHVFQSTYKIACHREQCTMQNVFFYRLVLKAIIHLTRVYPT